MALKAGYKGIKKFIADKLNSLSDFDSLATDAEVTKTISDSLDAVVGWNQEDTHDSVETLLNEKVDNSVVGPVEDDETASQAYSVGEHFIKNGKFCTAIQAIAEGATLTENTNYTVGNVATCLNQIDGTINITEAGTGAGITSSYKDIKKIGNVVNFSMRFTLTQPVSSAVAFASLGFVPLLTESIKLPVFSIDTLELATILYIDPSSRLHFYTNVNLPAGSYTVSGIYLSK